MEREKQDASTRKKCLTVQSALFTIRCMNFLEATMNGSKRGNTAWRQDTHTVLCGENCPMSSARYPRLSAISAHAFIEQTGFIMQ